jgi:hypothetical protein
LFIFFSSRSKRRAHRHCSVGIAGTSDGDPSTSRSVSRSDGRQAPVVRNPASVCGRMSFVRDASIVGVKANSCRWTAHGSSGGQCMGASERAGERGFVHLYRVHRKSTRRAIQKHPARNVIYSRAPLAAVDTNDGNVTICKSPIERWQRRVCVCVCVCVRARARLPRKCERGAPRRRNAFPRSIAGFRLNDSKMDAEFHHDNVMHAGLIVDFRRSIPPKCNRPIRETAAKSIDAASLI